MNNKQYLYVVFIFCNLLFGVFGFIAGEIVGEYNEMNYLNKMLNNSANSNIHLIRDNNIYYSIHPYNVSNCNINTKCFLNLSLNISK